MKQRKRILKGGRILGLFLALGLMLTPALGAQRVHAADADEPYTYTVRVFGGNRGTITGTSEFTGLKVGDSVPFDFASQVNVTDKRYYAKGLREAGKDTGAYMTSIPAVTGDSEPCVGYAAARLPDLDIPHQSADKNHTVNSAHYLLSLVSGLSSMLTIMKRTMLGLMRIKRSNSLSPAFSASKVTIT